MCDCPASVLKDGRSDVEERERLFAHAKLIGMDSDMLELLTGRFDVQEMSAQVSERNGTTRRRREGIKTFPVQSRRFFLSVLN